MAAVRERLMIHSVMTPTFVPAISVTLSWTVNIPTTPFLVMTGRFVTEETLAWGEAVYRRETLAAPQGLSVMKEVTLV
jgi:hypothetical protein